MSAAPSKISVSGSTLGKLPHVNLKEGNSEIGIPRKTGAFAIAYVAQPQPDHELATIQISEETCSSLASGDSSRA
jgi:hypothetical protein